MAYSYSWAGTGLPQNPQKGFSETGGVLVIRTPTDQGPAKMRYRGAKPQVLSISFLMTSAQVVLLEAFVKDTIKGTARFGFPHPRLITALGAPLMVEVRMVPQGSGDYYNLTYTAPGYWNVALQLEVLP
jgi:hypothetical protein